MSTRVLARVAAAAAVLLAATPRLAAQFGKNQVEYTHFEWHVIETQHFLIHYYPSEATAAMDVARMSERSYERLSRIFQWEFRDKKPIMLFASRADFGENLVTGDLGEGTGGVTEPLRHRMLFFFTGNYRSTEHVLTHEMVHEFQFDIFGHGKAGGGLGALEAVNPPLWYMEGMAEYLSKGPGDPHTAIVMRDAAAENNVPTLAQMTNDPGQYFPYRFGESFFAYVGRHWGDEVIGQIMLDTPNLGIERAFEKATNKTTAQIAAEWRQAILDEYLPTLSTLKRARTEAQPVLTTHRSGGDIFVDPALSPDGKYLVFLSNGSLNKGEVFIDLWLADATTGKRIKRLIKSTLDPNYEEIGLLYSQAAFSPDGKRLAFSALSGGKEVLYVLDVAKQKRIATISLPLDGLTGPSWSPDGTKIVFSGARGGITDIYIVDADGKNLTQLTHDRNGDAMPQWSPDGETIAFASERGVGTDIANLVFPRMRITLYHLATHEIEVLPDQSGLNINPNWSPDGKTIAFVSDRGGAPNIYLYDLESRAQFQITNFVGGVTGITDVSPALSWAHAADRLAFVYYENNGYTIWTVDEPRKLERTPVGAVALAAAAAAAPAAAAEAPPPALGSVSGDPVATYYKGALGFRPAQSLPGARDSTAEPVINVAAILDTGDIKLPDTSTFFQYPYKLKLYPEYVASPTIGYSHDNFGSGLYGGTAITLTDMTGATQATVALAVNGRLADFQFYAAYAYLAGRMQYQFGVENVPFYYSNGYGCTPDGTLCQSAVTRYLNRSIFGVGLYPLNRFDRWEVGLGLNALNRQYMVTTVDYVAQSQVTSTQDLGTKFYAMPDIAYVSDNTLFGYFAPISGRRYRIELQPAVGGFQWMGYLVDYRRYDPIVFNKLIIAWHVEAYIKTGPDADSTRQYIAYSQAVRGYDGSNFAVNTSFCPQNVNPDYCNPGVGSSATFGNFEIRAPFYRGGAGSVIPVPPIELFVFQDAGVAWFRGQTVIFARQANLDPYTQRGLLTSTGFGARLNLFGAAILSWAWVIPHDLGLGPYIQFSLYAPF